ncbi:MAG: hypothetical protein ACRDWX_14620 [Acidimicrobiia bacterium]
MAQLETAPGRHPWKLLAVSFLSLYLELALIRWVPSTLHIVAFFSNLVLIASFLGLGIGMTRPRPVAASVERAFLRLAVTSALLAIFRSFAVDVSGSAYAVNETGGALAFTVPLPLILIVVFGLIAWTSIPLGSLVAAYFDGLERIPAYSINIAGSLLGVLAFSAVAWLRLPPVIWFGVGLTLLGLVDRRGRHLLPASAFVSVLALVHLADSNMLRDEVRWSPYYKVVASSIDPQTRDLGAGFVLRVNNQFLLSGLDLRPEARPPAGVDHQVARHHELLKSYYDLPFQLRRVDRALVLGSGAGNDVAAGLRHGVEHVTAVEIDPLVLDFGREHHPERPYQSPGVELVLDDGRAYLNRSHEKFDLVLFATLDAHGLLSSMGSVRLDSFIYTEESLQSAKDRLTENGLLVLSFGPFREDVQLRQYSMVRSIFGQEPLYFLHDNGHRTIVAGHLEGITMAGLPQQWRRISPTEVGSRLEHHPHAAIPATDDWPHLYLRQRTIPPEYLVVLGGIMILSAFLVRRSFRGARSLDGHFFFLGAGFLLLETKSVTEYALLIGSTWQTNSLVFSVILLVILAANLLVLTVLRRAWLPGCYLLIFLSLLAGFLWPISRWASSLGSLAVLAAGMYLGVPIFLAAIVFASTFRHARLGSAALASNLLGAVLGGAAEYLSLAVGIRALSLLALAMYAGSLAFWSLRSRVPVPEPSPLHAPA